MQQSTIHEAFTDKGIPTISKVKFEVYGLEMKEKQVKSNGKTERVSGRVYLPLSWIGRTVKIIKV